MRIKSLSRIVRRFAKELGIESTTGERRLLCTELEDRTMLSAAPMDPAMAAPAPADNPDATAAAPDTSAGNSTTAAPDSSTDNSAAAPDSTTSGGETSNGATTGGGATATDVAKKEIVFLDSSAENYQELLTTLMDKASADSSLKVVLLDDSTDGIQKVSETLSQYHDLTTVHFLTSGTDGGVKLGNQMLTVDSLAGRAGEVALWHNALQPSGDLMFYGCDLGATDAGAELLAGIAALTGDGVGAGETMIKASTEAPANLVDVVLIDKNLDDVETLTKAVLAGDQIFLYDGTDESAADVLADVVNWANATHSRISTFSILSHGAAGAFEVGNQWVTTSFLEQTAAGWQQLSMVLAEQATINLYSCDVVTAGSDGQMLIDRLSQLTGAAVYASANTTGNGGDWVLEAASFGAQPSLTNLTPTLDMQLLESSAATLAWYNASWQYRQTLTIDNAMVSGTNDLTNFTVLVSITDADLKSSGYGGMVGQTDGGDLLFTSADGTTKLDHEIESYDATTGTLRAWVRIPTLSFSADTQLYIYYGNAAAADQWNSSGTWGSNVKAVYHLDVNYNDSTSNANNGTNSGTTNLTSAQIAGGDTFNGSSQNINVADSSSLDITGNFTLSAWFSKTGNSGYDVILSKGNTTTQVNYYLATSGTELVVGFTDSGGTWRELATSGLGLTTGTWYHAAATYDDAANTWKLYLDGNQVASGSTTYSILANTGSLTIGKSPWGEWFAGSLDEVKVESTTRSADWINTQFNNQDSPATYVKLAAAPVNTVPAAQQASGITPLTFSTANGNAISVSDADGGASIEKVTLSVNNGTLSLGSTAGLTFLIGDGTSDASMSFTGTLANINTALQGLSYTVTPFFSGMDTLTIVTDDQDPADAHTDTDTVTINVAAPGTPYVITGSYTGDGTDNRNITGIGFQPDVVLIKARTNQIGVIRTSSMSGDLSKDMTGATALQANHIQSLLADGFQLGTDATVNSSGVVYDYIVFKASTGFLTVGSYSGNGVDNRAITGLGMSPDALFVMSASGSEAVFSTTADEGNTYNFNNGTAGTNHIQSLDGDGFSLGTDTRVNGSGVTYHYIAWNEMAGAMDVGSYSGTGVDNRNITGVGFQAEWLMVQSGGKDTVAHFDSQGATTDTSSFLDGTAPTTNRIQQLQSDGFQVGTDADVNSSGVSYQYLAFKQQTQTTISSISNQTILEDGTTGAIAFTIGDAETSVSNLSVRVTSSNSTLVPTANMVLGGSGANRTLTITPPANLNGTATITVDVTDGATISTRTFTFTVTAVNDVPIRTAGSPAAVSVNEDSANTTAVSLGLSGLTYGTGGGSDEAAQTLTYKVSAIPSCVTVWLADGTTQVTANTTLSLAQLQGLKYKTVADAVGTGNLTWTVQDNGGMANGGVDLLTETLAITVGAVNDVPVRTAGNPSAISVNEDSANTTAVTIGMSGMTYGVGGGSDEAAQTLTYKVTVIPSAITVWLADGTTQVAANTTLSLAQLQGLKYKTVADSVGSGNLTWTVQDNGGTSNGGVDLLTETLSITVGAVNDAPVRTAGNPAAISVNEDSANSTAVTLGMNALTYGVGGGADEAAQTLTYKVTAIPSAITVWLADGTTQVTANTTLSLAQLQGLKYKTVADVVGSGNLTWTVQDNGGTSNGGVDLLTETLAITVGAVNDQPVRTAGNPTAISVNEDAANSTAVTLGMSALTYGVGGGSDEVGQTLTYKVTVIPSCMTLWLADGTTQVAANSTLSLAQLQGLKYKTIADVVGTGNLTWTVQDNGGTSNGGVDLLTETLSITVGAVNDAPVRTAGNPAAISVNEDSANSTAVTLGMSALTYGIGGGSDEAGQTLTYKVTVIPSCMTLWLADGTTQVAANTTLSLAQLQGLKYKTVADTVGSGNLTWTVQDNGGTANGGVDLLNETLSITVGAINDAPVRSAGNPSAISVNEDSASSTAVTLGMSALTYGVGGGSDEAGQALTYKVTVIPSCMTLWLADGTTQVFANTTLSLAQLQGLKYKTVADAVGSGNLTWTVQDNGGTSNGGVDLLTETLAITVGAVNDAPVRTAGNPTAISVNEDSANSTAVTLGMSALTYGVGGGADEAAQTLTYKLTVIPSAITVWLADGTTQVAANTTLSLAQLQGLKYKTVADTVGSGNLTWTAQDNGGTSNGGVDLLTETLAITVGAVNDAPVRSAGNPSAISVNEDSANSTAVTLGMSALTYGVGGGSDESGQTLTYKVTEIPSCMTLWLADGTTQVSANTTLSLAQLQGLKYKTVADAVGSGNLTWTIQDNGGTANGGIDLLTETLSITVGSVNDQPVRTAGNPAAISVNEDSANSTAVTLGMSGLTYGVGGGADEAAQTLTYKVTVIPSAISVWLADGTTQVTANTTLSLAQLQGLKYKTVADTVGSGNLTWTIQDNGGTSNGGVDLLTETLSITVGTVNDQPVRTAGNVNNLTVAEDSGITSLGLGGLTYGVGGGSDEASQTLTYTIIAVPSAALGNIVLADGTTVVTANTSYSLAQLQGMQFKTAANANGGPATFSWTIQDDGGTANGGVDLLAESLTVTVSAVNDVPVNTVPGAQSTNEDTTLVFSSGNGNLISIADVDAGSSSMSVTLSVAHGTLTLSGTTGLSFNSGANGAATMTFTGTAAHINAALAGMSYLSTANYNGADTLTITTNDQGNTGSGGALSDTDTVAITVRAVNDAPINSVPGAQSTPEETALTFSSAGGNAISVSDVDAGSGELSVTLGVAHGTLTLSGTTGLTFTAGTDGAASLTFTGSAANINAALAGMVYAPTTNYNGSDTLTITTDDQGNSGSGGALTDTDTVTITVGAINDAPIRTAGTVADLAVEEDSGTTSLGLGGLTYGPGGGSSESSQTLTYTVTAVPSTSLGNIVLADGTTVVTANTTYTLAQLCGMQFKTATNANGGPATFSLAIQDNGGTAGGGVDTLAESLSITVGAVNDAPVRTAGSPSPINVNEDSADSTAASLGTNFLTYGVGGGADEASQTLTYTMTGIPSCITLWLADGTTQITANTTLSLTQLQGLKYKTIADTIGSGNLTWTVQDNGGTANSGVDLLSESLSITVGAVNDAPIRTAGNPAAISVNEDSANSTAVTLGMSGLTYGVGGGADEASQSLTYSVTGIPSCITLWLADGTTQVTANTTLSLSQLQGLKYKTIADTVGNGNLTWTVQDDGGTANGGVDLLTESLAITVGDVNDAPIRTAGNPAAISVNEDAANSTAVSLGMGSLTYGPGGGADEASQSLTYKVTAIPSHVTLWLADGTTQVTANTTLSLAQLQGLKYKTVADSVGTGNLTWTVQDDGGTANGGVDLLTETLAITVGAVNDAPIRTAGNPSAISVNEDSANATAVTLGMSSLTYGVGGGTDEASQTLTYAVTGIPSCVTLWLADGTTQVTANTTISLAQLQGLKYKTVADAVGTGNLTWTVQDNGGTANGGVDLHTETLSITVGSVNDAPVRTAGNPSPISVNEDSADSTAVTLGMTALTYGVGGGADEASQTLTYKLTGIPSAITVWLADGTTQVTANMTLSLAQLQGLKYKTVADTVGTGNLTWTVQDDGGTVNDGVDLLTESLSITVGAVNDAPVRTAGTPAAISVNEDSADSTAVTLGMTALTYGVGGGADEASQTLTYKLTGIPSAITVWLADGTTQVTANTTLSLAQLQGLKYKNVADAVGTGNLTWTVQDNGGTANGGVDLLSESLSITVGAINDAPVRTAGSVNDLTVAEDSGATSLGLGGLTYGVGGGADEASQTLTYIVTAVPSASLGNIVLADGTTVVAANTTYSLAQLRGMQFKTAADANGGPATFSWTIQDNGGTANGGLDSLTESLSISVGAVNDAPALSGTNDLAGIDEDDVTNSGTLVSSLIAGMVSDTDSGAMAGIAVVGVDNTHGTWEYSTDGGTNWSAFGTPSNGAARLLAADGATRVRFVPATNFNGTVAGLTFRAWDRTSGIAGGVADASTNDGPSAFSSATATAGIVVNAVNDAPTNTVPGSQWTDEDTALVFSSGNGNLISIADVDAGSSSISVTLSVAHGSLTLSGTTGLSFTSGANSAATMTFTGSVSNINAALAGMSYLPTTNYNGTDTLTITTDDQGNVGSGGALSDTDTVAIAVGAVNDAPINSVPGVQSTNEDTDLVFSNGNGNLISIGDIDAGSSSMSVTLSVAHGTLLLSSTSGLSFTAGADGAASMTFTGSIASINAALAGMTYSPTTSYSGTDTLTITTNDQGNSGSGGARSDTDTVTIAIGAVNHAPVRTAGSVSDLTVAEDSGTTSLGLGGLTYGPGGGGFESTQSLTYTVTAVPGASLGNIVLADGTTVVTAGTSYSLAQLQGMQFKTATNANGGPATFAWTVQDNGGTSNGGVDLLTESLSITVWAVNDVPVRTVGNPSPINVNEDSANTTAVSLGLSGLTYGVGGGSDESAQTLTYQVTSIPSCVTVWLADGTTQVTANSTLSLAQLQGLKYKTVADTVGVGNLTWTVQDNGGTSNGGVDLLTETLAITVGAVNDIPVRTAGSPSAINVNEDSANTTTMSLGMSGLAYGVGGGSDEASQTLTYQVTAIPSCVTVWLADGTTQVSANTTLSLAQLQGLKYKTVADSVGSGNLTWTVQDNGGTANGGVDLLTETLSITVGAVNDVPVRTASNPSAISVNEDSANTTAVTLGMSGLTYGVGGGSDEASQTLTYTVTAIPSFTTLWLADGTTQVTANTTLSLAQLQGLKYKTVADTVGSGNLTWTVQDNGGTANGGVDLLTETLSISVGAVNDVPVRTAGSVNDLTVAEDSGSTSLGLDGLTYGVGGGVDEASQTLTYTVTAVPSSALGNIVLADGTTVVTSNTAYSLAQLQGIQFKTAANANGGPATFSWTVQDSGGTANGGVDLLTESLAITVVAVNDAPVNSVSGSQSILQDTSLIFSTADGNALSITDVDAGSNSLSVTLRVGHGTLTLGQTTGLTFTSGADGTATMTFTGTAATINGALDGFTYAPTTNYNGSDLLTITTDDQGNTGAGGAQTDTDSIVIAIGAVNHAPVRTAGTVGNLSVLEDSGTTSLALGSLAYGPGSGEASQTLTYMVTTVPSSALGDIVLADGTTVVTSNTTYTLAQLQGMQFKTAANSNGGPATFSWTIQDDGGTSNGGVDLLTETLTITVGAVNDVSVRTAGNPSPISADEDSANTTAVSLGMSGLTYGVGGGSDEASQTLTYKVTAIPSCVTVWLADGTTQVSANTTLSLAQLQGLKYKTVADAVGSGNLTWTVQDNGGTANGGVDLLTETLSITVGSVNDIPVRTTGNPSPISVNEDSANTTAVTLGTSGLTYGVGGGSDETSQTLTYQVTAIPSSITLWLADGTTQVTANTTLSLAQLQGLKYKTVADAVGSGSLTWTVQDNGGTSNGGVDLLTESLSITVGSVNDAPVPTAGNPSPINVNEDSANGTALTLGLGGLAYGVGGGSDEASQTLTYKVTAIPSYTTLWLADGSTQVTANTTLSLAQLQSLKYKTVADAVGSGNLIWTVQDNGGTANGGVDLLTETLSITVGSVNDIPVRSAGNPAAISVNEDSANSTATSLGMSGLTYGVGGGSDDVSQTLTYKVTAIPSTITVWLADGTTPVVANTTLSLAQLQGLQYKTVADAVGSGNLTWTVQDDGGTANGGVDLLTEMLSISVGSVNDVPVRSAGNPAAISVNEDSANSTAVSLGMSGLTYGVGGGSDESSQTLTYQITAIPSHITVWLADGMTQVSANATLSLAQLQGLKYKTVSDAVGTGNLTWTVQDNGGTSNGGVDLLTETLSITVGAVNDAPVRTAGSPSPISVDEGSANTTAVTLGMSGLTYGVGGGSDEASQTFSYQVTAIPSAVTLWLADGTTQVSANTTLSLAQLQGLKYKTVSDAVGSGNLTWTVQDNGGTANGGVDLLTEMLGMTVGAVNDAPIRTAGNPSAISVNEDSANPTAVSLGMSGLTYGVGGGSDEAGQTLTYKVTSIPSAVTLWLADGTTQVSANTPLSLAQLQGLKYKTVADAVGSGNLTWTVQDDGDTANGGVDLLTETLAITVGAVNDAPVRTAGSVNDLTVAEDSGTTSLGLGGLTYGVGGGVDEASQTLAYTVTAIPSSALGNIVLADGATVVTANTTYSLAQLQGMQFKTATNANGGPATFSWTVQDSGSTANGGADLLAESLAITVRPEDHLPATVSVPGQQTATSLGLTFSAASHNAITVTGASDHGSIVVTIQATNGVVTLGNSSGITFIQGYGIGDQLLKISGTADQLNTALNGLYYRANAMYGGITIQVVDSAGSSASAGIPITQAPLVDYGTSIASTDDTELVSIRSIQINRGEFARTTAAAATAMAAGDALPIMVLPTSTNGAPTMPTSTSRSIFDVTTSRPEMEPAVVSEIEATPAQRLNDGRPDNVFRNEPPPAVQSGEELEVDLEVRSLEAAQTPTKKIDDEPLKVIEQDSTEAASEQTTAEVVENAILALTSGYLTYSLAFDQVLRSRVQDILEASTRNGDQPF